MWLVGNWGKNIINATMQNKVRIFSAMLSFNFINIPSFQKSKLLITGDIIIPKIGAAAKAKPTIERAISASSLSVRKKIAEPMNIINNAKMIIKCVLNAIFRSFFMTIPPIQKRQLPPPRNCFVLLE